MEACTADTESEMFLHRCSGLTCIASLLLSVACSGGTDGVQSTSGGAGGGAGSAPAAGGGVPGNGGTTASFGASAGANESGGAVPDAGGANGTAGSGAQVGTGGAGGAATGGGVAGLAGSTGVGPSGEDPKPPRPINVTPGPAFNGNFNGQPMSVNKSKPIVAKLVLLLGGICTGTGAGGFEAFVKQNGFHVFAPKTQTCVTSAPDKYKATIKTSPDDKEANRQVADARVELWDGVDRVDWVTVNKGESIVEETVGAIKNGMVADPGGDWGYFLNTDGSLRTTDVWVVGYSWGSQSWAMISSYVRFGRVIITSGPVSEGFPNAEWITHPAATGTPGDRKYMLVDLPSPYPAAGAANMEKFDNVIKGGWTGMVTSVTPNGMGTYTADQHLFAMIGSNNTSPGGHTVFCTDNSMNGWLPVCKHVLNLPP